MTPHIRLVRPTQLDSTGPILLWYQETPFVDGAGGCSELKIWFQEKVLAPIYKN